MTKQEPLFRSVYVGQPGHDFSALLQHTDQIKYLTSGWERLEHIPDAIRTALEEFDPDQDAVVAVGRANATMLLGVELRSMFPGEEITLGVYRSKVVDQEEYQWVSVKME